MASSRERLWDRSIVAMIVGIFCATCAALICVTALGKQVYDLTHRELDLGLLGLSEFAPSALLVLVTGSLADRHDRRRISAAAAAVEGCTGIALALYTASDPTSAGPIFALVILFGAGRAFHAPANRALPADIVPADRLPWLQARRGVTWQSAIIVGPVLGGTLYAINPVYPYVAMAVLLFVSSAAMFFVNVPLRSAPLSPASVDLETELDPTIAAPPARGRLREALEGLAFIRRSPVLLGAISLDLFAVLFGGAVALLPAIAEDRLHTGAVGLGWLRAAGGIGAAAVTVVIARRPVERHVGRTLLLVVALFGVFTIVLGITTSFVIAFIAMLVLSGADAVSVFIRSTLVPLVTPSDKRGRVLAVESVFIGASNELGAFESGVAGQILGAPGAIVLGGAATLTIAAAYWVRFPALRKVDRFPQHTDAGFVPDGFLPPTEHRTDRFVLRPLGAEHNERDYDAWSSSIDHIRATPGYEKSSWPRPMSIDDNARDIAQHEDDFRLRRGFTYTVLAPDDASVIGCVYIYPGDGGADVRSWVRESRAELDRALYEAVLTWLRTSWPFDSVRYAPR